MLVKICGITREQDACTAVEQGAHAVGFIFWPRSPRFVEPSLVRRIVRTLPPFVTPVGVFVNESADRINAVAEQAHLGAVQLHGDESLDLLAAIDRPIIKSVSQLAPDTADRWPSTVMLLVDADDPARRGGTGLKADWHAASRLAVRRPVLLAGGLTPENVEEAIDTVGPFGIDISSGVESAPGIKSPQRIKSLFEAIRRATEAQ